MGDIFLLLCMPDTFGLDARHCDFTLREAIYFYIPLNILTLFWNVVTWKLIIWGLAFKIR